MRSANAFVGSTAVITRSVAAVSAATGLRFVFDGATTEAPSNDRAAYQKDRYGDRWAPVIIAWATADEVPDFGVDVAGEAGPQTVRRPSGQLTYVTGSVYLDAPSAAALQLQGRQSVEETIVEHELGHLVGLAHVNDPSQVMYPRAAALVGYQVGDLAGLGALGRGRCTPDV